MTGNDNPEVPRDPKGRQAALSHPPAAPPSARHSSRPLRGRSPSPPPTARALCRPERGRHGRPSRGLPAVAGISPSVVRLSSRAEPRDLASNPLSFGVCLSIPNLPVPSLEPFGPHSAMECRLSPSLRLSQFTRRGGRPPRLCGELLCRFAVPLGHCLLPFAVCRSPSLRLSLRSLRPLR